MKNLEIETPKAKKLLVAAINISLNDTLLRLCKEQAKAPYDAALRRQLIEESEILSDYLEQLED